MNRFELLVTNEFENTRVDKFVSDNCEELTRSSVQKLIESNCVFVNKKSVSKRKHYK